MFPFLSSFSSLPRPAQGAAPFMCAGLWLGRRYISRPLIGQRGLESDNFNSNPSSEKNKTIDQVEQ